MSHQKKGSSHTQKRIEMREAQAIATTVEVVEWIAEEVPEVHDLNEDNFYHKIHPGIILCQLVSAVGEKCRREDVRKVVSGYHQHFHSKSSWEARENVHMFLSALGLLGISEQSRFEVADLDAAAEGDVECQKRVLDCFVALKRYTLANAVPVVVQAPPSAVNVTSPLLPGQDSPTSNLTKSSNLTDPPVSNLTSPILITPASNLNTDSPKSNGRNSKKDMRRTQRVQFAEPKSEPEPEPESQLKSKSDCAQCECKSKPTTTISEPESMSSTTSYVRWGLVVLFAVAATFVTARIVSSKSRK
eukprot:TRINITY_DN11784_c0_g1_i1.p1 TRINITY_DN11784_c0_g1~~TRINITY_DN11784_c0_g1_i1.p1  ORF type:complete len:302 (+),score=12.65 TRINITY_DN11784_c0_g1_i1:155-1060(+)